MGNTGTFRSAINGFNRQDVMDYLESASQRYEALKKEKTELERIRTEQQALVSELEALHKESAARNDADAQEIARLQEQLKALEEECRLLRDSVAELEAEKEAATILAEGENEYMRILQDAYNTDDKADFYNYTRSLDALKASLTGGSKTVMLDKDSELARILYGDFEG